jgi:predicted DNA binding CopG/RHH family protein
MPTKADRPKVPKFGEQAEARGLPYQTYIKSVLHEALVQRQRQQAS